MGQERSRLFFSTRSDAWVGDVFSVLCWGSSNNFFHKSAKVRTTSGTKKLKKFVACVAMMDQRGLEVIEQNKGTKTAF